VLTVQHYESPSAFSEQDVEFLAAIAGQIAMVIHQRRAEHALRVSEERYRDLVESATDIIYRHDLDYRFTSLNKAAERITGYSREEALTMTLADIVAPDHLATVMERIRDKLAGADQTPFEADIITKDGRRLTVEANAHLIYEHGMPVCVQGIARDITERKMLETQLRQAQKMEAIGHLAGGIAHDFNNLLVVINGYSELLLRTTESQTLRRDLAEIKAAGERATALTRQLLAFSRRQVLEPVVLDLNHVISGVSRFLDRLIGDDVKIVLALAPELGRIRADPGQLEQIIMNLAINARDAMPDGGTVVIETANSYLDGHYAQRHAAVVPGRYVMLAVTDSGMGMSAETRERIFEPFFTTKPEGQGTGLGLPTVYGIVKQSGGNIWVYSERGRGTTFKIYLPTLTEAPAQPYAAELPDKPSSGFETILLVEDDGSVRALMQRILENAGYRVLAAADGAEALALSERTQGRIDLLITDIVMPQMSGRRLAEELEGRQPQLNTLYMSGYPERAIVHHGVLEDGVAFIQKPFAMEALLRKVRATFQGRDA
jgi:PAS domain S-box-containing protein